jgi:hypothetical protein
MRDIYHNVLATNVLNPITSTATKTSTTIDTQGYNSASVVFSLGLSGDVLSGSLFWTLTLQHSDDNATYTACAAADCNSGTNSVVVNGTTLDRQAYSLGYLGTKRYVQALATPTGAVVSGMPIGIVALRTKASYSPVVTP